MIPNWAPGGQALAPVPPEKNPFPLAWDLRGRFAVVYSGNLGRVHALESVLEAAALLRDLPEIVFLFVGDGPQRRTLESRAAARGLGNVRFLPAQPRAYLAASLSAADVHLVTLRDGCERLVFPSKLYGIAAVGRPVVYMGPTGAEIATTIRAGRFGLVVDPSDSAALADALRRLAGDPRTGQASGPRRSPGPAPAAVWAQPWRRGKHCSREAPRSRIRRWLGRARIAPGKRSPAGHRRDRIGFAAPGTCAWLVNRSYNIASEWRFPARSLRMNANFWHSNRRS